jgi:endonuclease-8
VPEGDVVWRAARRLDEALHGQRITRSEVRVPQLAAVDLAGRTVLEVVSVGKHLLVRFDDHRTLHSHLRMDGEWSLFPAGARWTGGPGHEIRLVLHTDAVAAVGYRLHDLALVPTAREDTLVGHLGPDLLAEDWGEASRAEAVLRLAADPDRPVGAALLDQRVVAGIGTVYRAETLFLSGVHPWTRAGSVPDPAGLIERAHRLLAANRGRGRQVTTGDVRRGQELWAYGRAGRPCRRCGTTLVRGELGDPAYERLVVWCPSCQPEPSA